MQIKLHTLLTIALFIQGFSFSALGSVSVYVQPGMQTYAFGSLDNVSPDDFVANLRELGLVDDSLNLTARGKQSNIVVLGGTFSQENWKRYFDLFHHLDPRFGREGASIVSILSLADVKTVAELGSDQKAKKGNYRVVEAMRFSQLIAVIGDQVFLGDTALDAVDKGFDQAETINGKVGELADTLQTTKTRAPQNSVGELFAEADKTKIDEQELARFLRQSGSTRVVVSSVGAGSESVFDLPSSESGSLRSAEFGLASSEPTVRDFKLPNGPETAIPDAGSGKRLIPEDAPSWKRRAFVCGSLFAGTALATGVGYQQITKVRPVSLEEAEANFEEACKKTQGVVNTKWGFFCECLKTGELYKPHLAVCK